MRERAIVADARDDSYAGEPATPHMVWLGMGNAGRSSDRGA